MQIGPNGPVPLDPGTYDYDDLRERLRIALAGPEQGRIARVRGALRAARFFASQIPVLRLLSLSTSTLKEGDAAAIEVYDVIDGVVLSGVMPAGMTLNSTGRTITGTPTAPGQFSMRLVQTLPGAIGSPAEQVFDLTIQSKDGTAPVIPDPIVIEPTDIGSDGTPAVDEPLTGIDPVFRYATIIRRRWLFGSTVLTPNATYTPRVEGVYKYVVDGQGDNGKPISSEAEIIVRATTPAPTPISIAGTPPKTGEVGQRYSFSPSTEGGTGTKVYALASGRLLAGLALNTETGAIAGTPTEAGTMIDLSVRVTDNTGNAATTPTTVTIASASGGSALTFDSTAITFDRTDVTFDGASTGPTNPAVEQDFAIGAASSTPGETATDQQDFAIGAASVAPGEADTAQQDFSISSASTPPKEGN